MDQEHLAEALCATERYYEERAAEFDERTIGRDMAEYYEAFLPLVPKGGSILDAGCGPGRDSLVFLQRGYVVTAFDASATAVKLASVRLGQRVLHLSFQQVEFDHAFDGVWACASLLHVPRAEMPDALSRLHGALKRGGVLYACVKRGTAEELREGRLFTDYEEDSLRQVFDASGGWTIERVWPTLEVRKDRRVRWLNVLART